MKIFFDALNTVIMLQFFKLLKLLFTIKKFLNIKCKILKCGCNTKVFKFLDCSIKIIVACIAFSRYWRPVVGLNVLRISYSGNKSYKSGQVHIFDNDNRKLKLH
jgi:hypothetical protein